MKLFSTLAMVLVCLNTFAQSTQKTVDELLTKTGSTAQIKQIEELFTAKMNEKKSTFSNPADFDKFSTIMKSAINAKDAEGYYIEYFRLKTNEDSLKKIIVLYNDPVLQEFNNMELEANSPAKRQEQMTFFQNLQSNPPSQSRILMLTKLNDELGGSEMAFNMIKNVIGSMAKGVNSIMPKDKQLSEAEIINKVNTELPANFAQQLNNQIVAMSLFTYKNASDEKLEQYLKVWQTPIGKYFVKHSFGALDYTFSKMGEKVGVAMKGMAKK
ncbi:hypothetical protein [Parabacteroides sp. FAFU027]|uniref:hypothetical protein n=1 Tax=Parabacteroides sp. FAFU027 TaxID=2922715 RepID=UPI001FAFC9AD|nr:hypothetical protein [Parabacteroides sp. FAFU027]